MAAKKKLPYQPNWERTSTSTGYKVVHCPDHPRAWSTGYVYVHVVVMEAKLGRLLRRGEVVHHDNEDRLDNDPDNLVLTSKVGHGKEHARPQRQVGLTCANCGKKFKRRLGQEPSKKGAKRAFCSRRCNGLANGFKGNHGVRHGTLVAYNYRGCRCSLCKEAKSRYYRSRKKALDADGRHPDS